MQTEYAKISIKESTKHKEETITYYILENEQFGIKIVSDNPEENEISLHNVVKTKENAEDILGQLIRNNNDLTQISYIVEDILKNQEDSQNKTLIS